MMMQTLSLHKKHRVPGGETAGLYPYEVHTRPADLPGTILTTGKRPATRKIVMDISPPHL